MLVLSRRVDESIQIGDNIKIKVVSIRGNVVRLGIESPPEIPVLRTELINKIKFDLRAQRDAIGQPPVQPQQ